VTFLGFEQFQIVFGEASCPATANGVDAVRSQPRFQVPHRPLQAKGRLGESQVAAGHVVRLHAEGGPADAVHFAHRRRTGPLINTV